MAWTTITQTIDDIQTMTQQSDFEIIKVKLACVSDAGATSTDLSAEVMKFVKNSFLWLVVCDPGAGGDAPTAAVQMQLANEDGINLFDSGAGAVLHTADTIFAGSWHAGMPPPIFDTCTFICETLGAANTADFYLYFAKGM